MGVKCGIVGLPNVGKSTLFNALTSTMAAEAANFPFCTIEPNVGKVAVPDERLSKLAQIANSAKIIPTQMEFVDIAGIVKGASKGEGLGNQFLSHIREVDAIIYVLRCFDDENITHVDGTVDPVRDAQNIEMELMLADLDSLEKRLPNLEKKSKNDKALQSIIVLVKQIIEVLTLGSPVYTMITDSNAEDIRQLQLLSSKPIMYVCNVDEASIISGNVYSQKVQQYVQSKKYAEVILVSAAIEQEISSLDSDLEKSEFLGTIGLEESGLARIIKASYKLLNLITYFTIGPKEAHAWTIQNGTMAPQAAGVIHGDFEKGFIRAETIAYTDFILCGGEVKAREQGKLRLEGKEYVVQDGDIMHFRFNV